MSVPGVVNFRIKLDASLFNVPIGAYGSDAVSVPYRVGFIDESDVTTYPVVTTVGSSIAAEAPITTANVFDQFTSKAILRRTNNSRHWESDVIATHTDVPRTAKQIIVQLSFPTGMRKQAIMSYNAYVAPDIHTHTFDIPAEPLQKSLDAYDAGDGPVLLPWGDADYAPQTAPEQVRANTPTVYELHSVLKTPAAFGNGTATVGYVFLMIILVAILALVAFIVTARMDMAKPGQGTVGEVVNGEA
jgi:hypothetical protein